MYRHFKVSLLIQWEIYLNCSMVRNSSTRTCCVLLAELIQLKSAKPQCLNMCFKSPSMEREEYKRKAIHIGMGLWAFYPLLVTKYYAFLILIVFLLLVLFVFREHRWKAAFDAMARPEDYNHGYLIGPLIYILAVFWCVGFYPPYIAAASFAIMAFGDGFATIVGRNIGKHTYSYSNKSVEGSAAFLVVAFAAVILILVVLTRFVAFEGLDGSIATLAKLSVVGSLCGAVVETLPFEELRRGGIIGRIILDDNFFVPVVSGLIMSLYVML